VVVPAPPVPVNDSRRYVLFFGRLSPEKGVTEVVRAWRDTTVDDWVLRIAGDGVLAGDIAREPRVEMLGNLDASELRLQIEGASAVVVPSLSPETFGLAAAEAMALARPVFVSRVGNLPDLVGDAGVVLPAGDAAAWTAALDRLKANPEAFVEMGERARVRVATRFAPEMALERTMDVYRVAAETRRKVEVAPVAAV
jgi:glycosyltransferase involved in cell wall biosynthesis